MNAWWRSLAPRERALLGVGALALLATLLWLLAVEPLSGRLQRAEAQAAAERALGAELRAQAAEAEALRAVLPSAAAPDLALEPALRAALEAAGLGETVTRFDAPDDTSVRLELSALPFDAFALWLEGVLRELDLTVERLTLRPDGVPGEVAGELTLARRGAATAG